MNAFSAMDDLDKAERQALDASEGGKARAQKLSRERRKEIARKAARARWAKIKRQKGIVLPDDQQASARTENDEISRVSGDIGQASARTEKEASLLPFAMYPGELNLFGNAVSCYVLSDGTRVLGRTTANEMLTGVKRAGDLERTIGALSVRPFLDYEKTISQFVPFSTSDADRLNVHAKGIPTDLFVDICRAFVAALQANYERDKTVDDQGDAVGLDSPPMTPKQQEIAMRASMFLAAVAKVGLDALVDEATGYQEFRERDELALKLKAYIADEMRKWEKTFPDELWVEFGRLTNWKGSLHRRPKYWGNLVMELVYEYLDPDVAEWLRENAPKPKRGQNYHQWLSSQYGLRQLMQHIWQVIGIGKTCEDISELRQKMAEQFGNGPIQLTLKLPRTL
jgi:hypothetical protein